MKIKVTLLNGDYPLSCVCNNLHEAYECAKATAELSRKTIDLDLVLDTLTGMQSGMTDVIEFGCGIRTEVVERTEAEKRKQDFYRSHSFNPKIRKK